MPGGVGDLGDGIQVILGQVLPIHGPEGEDLRPGAIHQRDRPGPIQLWVQAFGGHGLPDLVASDRLQAAAAGVADDEIAQLLVLVRLEAMQLEAGPLRAQPGLITGQNLMSPQPGQGVSADKQREVGKALDEVRVVALVLHQPAGDPQEECGVGGGPDGDPIVRLGGRGRVLRRDGDDLGAAFHGLHEEVRLGHLVLDQVLAALNMQARIA